MLDNTDTMRVPLLSVHGKPAAEDKTAEREPRNSLLILGVALVAAAATAIVVWVNDPKMSHAQAALITAVVMVVLAAAVLCSHYMRLWFRKVKAAIIAQVVAETSTIVKVVETSARQARAQRLDLSNDVSTSYAATQGMSSLLGDFTKRYPPVDIDDRLDRLTERVEALTCAVEGLPQALEPEWARALRRDLDALGTPDVADMEPMLNLRNIAQRLRDQEA